VLSNFANLESVDLGDNRVADISALSASANIGDLYLYDNQLDDTAAPVLASFAQLNYLNIDSNSLTTLPALSNTLTGLTARNNQLSTLPDFSGMVNLFNFDMTNNQLSTLPPLPTFITQTLVCNNRIENVSALNGLEQIEVLDIDRPVITNLQLTPNDVLDLDQNTQLSYVVQFDNSTDGNIEITSPSGIRFGGYIDGQGNPQMFFFDPTTNKGTWQVTRIQPNGGFFYYNNEYAIKTLYLGFDSDVEINSSAAEDSEQPVLLNVSALQILEMDNNQISDLTPLVSLSVLDVLAVEYNNVSVIPILPVSLNNLLLRGNSISDISNIAGLTNLGYLDIAENSIFDLSPITGFTNLRDLFLANNQLTALPPLPVGITEVYANRNQIEDISSLNGLTSITGLYLENNHLLLSDLTTVIASLATLQFLDIRTNASNGAGLSAFVSSMPATSIQSDTNRPDILNLTLTPAATLDLDISTEIRLSVDTGAGYNGNVEITSPNGIAVGSGLNSGSETIFYLGECRALISSVRLRVTTPSPFANY